MVWSAGISSRARGPRPSARAGCFGGLPCDPSACVSPCSSPSSRSCPRPAHPGRPPRSGPDRPVVLDANLRRLALGVTVKDGRQMAPSMRRASIGGRTRAGIERLGGPGPDFPTCGVACAGAGCDAADLGGSRVDPNALSSPTTPATPTSSRADTTTTSAASRGRRGTSGARSSSASLTRRTATTSPGE